MKSNVNSKFVINSLLAVNRVHMSAECIKSLIQVTDMISSQLPVLIIT